MYIFFCYKLRMLHYLESVLEGVFLGRPKCMLLSDLNSKYAIEALTYMFLFSDSCVTRL